MSVRYSHRRSFSEIVSVALAVVFGLGGALCSTSAFAVSWSELLNGDLSNDRLAPSVFTVSHGSNLLTGTMPMADLDYVTVDVPSLHILTGITLNSYASSDGTSFIGFQAGTTMTVENTTGSPAGLLGYTHFGTTPNNVTQNILPSMCTGAGAIGCAPPLPTGPYTFWIQQASNADVAYQFNFTVDFVPANSGDYNGDTFINAADYTVWRNTLGQKVFQSSGADGNNNGVIDNGDYAFWKEQYGEIVGGAGAVVGDVSTVPEPASALLALGALLLLPARSARRNGRGTK